MNLCQSCAYRKERDEWKAKAEKDSNYAMNAVDKICHYRNLAIILGAKPEHMLGEFDRKLCIDGIDKDDDGNGYHMSVQDCLDDVADTWGLVDKYKKENDKLREALERITRNGDRPGDMFSIAAAALEDL